MYTNRRKTNEVVSDKEFEEIKNDLANMRKEALKMLAENKNENSGCVLRIKNVLV